MEKHDTFEMAAEVSKMDALIAGANAIILDLEGHVEDCPEVERFFNLFYMIVDQMPKVTEFAKTAEAELANLRAYQFSGNEKKE